MPVTLIWCTFSLTSETFAFDFLLPLPLPWGFESLCQQSAALCADIHHRSTQISTVGSLEPLPMWRCFGILVTVLALLPNFPLTFTRFLEKASTSNGSSSRGVHVCCCLEDASAPQVIFCGRAQTIEVSKFFHVQLKLYLRWLARVRDGARLSYLIQNGISTVRFVVTSQQLQ